MGTYIKGMKPPKHCYDCDFNNGRICFANEEKTFDITEEYAKRIKHPDCPLIEVKAPHGRLIDADDVNERIRKSLSLRSLDYLLEAEKPIVRSIKESPTVIESEVE